MIAINIPRDFLLRNLAKWKYRDRVKDYPEIHQEVALFERYRAANQHTVSQLTHLLRNNSYLFW